MSTTLPKDSAERKEIPLYEGLVKYFPAALAAVARVSKRGNDKHNPGQPLHHARGKSADHADCILRHLVDLSENDGREPTELCGAEVCSTYPDCGPACDPDQCDLGSDWNTLGVPQVAYIAWRALALCQEWLEKHEGAPLAPGAKLPELSPAEQVLAHEGAFTIGDLVRLPDIKVTYVKRGPHGEYGQERRSGPKDRRRFHNHEVANRNGRNRTDIGLHKAGRRSTDTLHWFFLPEDRRVGETDRRKVQNEFIARDKGYRRRGQSSWGRRSTDKTPFWTLPRVGL